MQGGQKRRKATQSLCDYSSLIFLDLRRASIQYPLGRRKLQYLIRDGRLRAYRVDGKIVLKREDLEQLLTSKPVGADLNAIVNEVMAKLRAKS